MGLPSWRLCRVPCCRFFAEWRLPITVRIPIGVGDDSVGKVERGRLVRHGRSDIARRQCRRSQRHIGFQEILQPECRRGRGGVGTRASPFTSQACNGTLKERGESCQIDPLTFWVSCRRSSFRQLLSAHTPRTATRCSIASESPGVPGSPIGAQRSTLLRSLMGRRAAVPFPAICSRNEPIMSRSSHNAIRGCLRRRPTT